MAEKTGCTCGCSEMTVVTKAEEACTCGCECCGTPETTEAEIAHLRSLRAAVETRLVELGVAVPTTR